MPGAIPGDLLTTTACHLLARTIDKVYVNFFVSYDMDDEDEPPVPHVLTNGRYKTAEDAEYDAWMLLEEDVADVEQEVEQEE